ncbi:MAG: hypothetical protein ACJ0RG_10470 [Candidatus Azotimanducaceae bacterium]
MEYLRIKVAVAALLGAVCSFVSAESIEACTEIKDPTTRLACYDNALQKDVPKSVLEPKSTQAPKSTQVTKEAKDLASTKVTERILKDAIKKELPRRGASEKRPRIDDITRYTVTKVVTKYGGKIEYLTDNGRRFRKISTSPQSFKVGDVLVAKLGVFESVFLVNQDGKRIKVKIMD